MSKLGVCESCGINVQTGESFCYSCSSKSKKNAVDLTRNHYQKEDIYNKICLCGSRGRNIQVAVGTDAKGNPKHDTVIRCFECYHREQDKKFFSSANDWVPKLLPLERAYLIATNEYYLKPIFYGESSNYETLSQAHDLILISESIRSAFVYKEIKSGYEYFQENVCKMQFGSMLRRKWNKSEKIECPF